MRQQIIGVDLTRFLAAMLVMLYHMLYWRNGNIPPEADTCHSIWRFGWLGVEIFFVISGYVIAYSAQASSAQKFAWSRFYRIYPTVWVCATITLVVMLSLGLINASIIKRYFATLVVMPVGSHIDIVYWTLTVELFFYMLVAIALYVSNFEAVVRLVVSIGIASVLFNAISLFAQQAPDADGFLSVVRHISSMHTTRLLLFRHGCFFALGVLLWKRTVVVVGVWDKPIAGILLIGSVLEVLFTIGVHRIQFPDENFSSLVIVMIWLVAYFFIDLMVRPKTNKFFQKYGLGRLFRILGLLTFPIYLLHNEAGLALRMIFVYMGWNDFMAAAVAMVMVISCAWIVCFYIEPLVGGLVRRWLNYLPTDVARSTS